MGALVLLIIKSRVTEAKASGNATKDGHKSVRERRIDMEREKVLQEIWHKAIEIMNNWTRDGENAIWDMASDYNRDHDDEIFVCEDWESDDVKRLYVEDDYVVIEF